MTTRSRCWRYRAICFWPSSTVSAAAPPQVRTGFVTLTPAGSAGLDVIAPAPTLPSAPLPVRVVARIRRAGGRPHAVQAVAEGDDARSRGRRCRRAGPAAAAAALPAAAGGRGREPRAPRCRDRRCASTAPSRSTRRSPPRGSRVCASRTAWSGAPVPFGSTSFTTRACWVTLTALTPAHRSFAVPLAVWIRSHVITRAASVVSSSAGGRSPTPASSGSTSSQRPSPFAPGASAGRSRACRGR